MNSIYNINWFRLVKMLVLPAINKPTLLAFINSGLSPLRSRYDEFLGFKADAEYRVNHNGQICYLQKMLNDKFDNSLRRIKVQNVKPKARLWFYYEQDDKPVYFYNEADHPEFFYNPEDYYNEFDFEVLIPTVLNTQTNLMKVQINYYKLYSKNFQIIEL